MIKFILMDIEGTITSIDFVKKKLFPYARKKITNYINYKFETPDFQDRMQREFSKTEFTKPELVKNFYLMMDGDVKNTTLKKIQGEIWQEGYESGQIQGHLYTDVVPEWKLWKKRDLTLGIFSSGSVQAQELLFQYSLFGDVRPYLSFYFDTVMGSKKDPETYKKIAFNCEFNPEEILFLSDVEEELVAAEKSSLHVAKLVREDAVDEDRPHYANLKEVSKLLDTLGV